VLEVTLPPETRSTLEDLMKALPREVFTAEDSLGWVYQFWQAEHKEAINRSEKKIGAEELPAVTQLFTEDYMVLFLLHNTLGAWWAGKMLAKNPVLATTAASEDELRAACAVDGIEWTYLRFVCEGEQPRRPAAGTFDGWPKAAKDITLLDPCMGSGHFLVFALPMLAALRAEEERLSPEAAIEAVLRDNLYGLEIDARCTQIAAFNLALAAWRRVGYRALPALHLACSGLSPGVTKAEWFKLAERAAAALPMPPKTDLLATEENLFSDAMKRGFERLYDLFARAPWLGSLIEPRGASGDLIEHGFADLEPLLAEVMAKADSAELSEMAVVAQGLAKAAETLAGRFTLIATNVPYLGRGKQDEVLKDYCERMHGEAKADLATCFVERCLDLCAEGGCTALVTPQNWLFLSTYKKLRKRLLEEMKWNVVARLGPRAFETITGEVVNVALLALTRRGPVEKHTFAGVDAVNASDPAGKANALGLDIVTVVGQLAQLNNPSCRITLENPTGHARLGDYADSWQGLVTSDTQRFTVKFWEIENRGSVWEWFVSSPDDTAEFVGRGLLVRWEQANGVLHNNSGAHNFPPRSALGRPGVLVSQIGSVRATRYLGEIFNDLSVPIIPHDEKHLSAIFALCSDPTFTQAVRTQTQSLQIRVGYFLGVPFDLRHWQQVAAEKYPDGLPKPHSNDPVQWLFNGHPRSADLPLQVAVARLVGYRWPRQTGSSFPDCPAFAPDGLEKHADRDGIVTLSPVKGEPPAADRLTALLADAFGADWSAAMLASLLSDAGFAGKTLDDWLRDGFFVQHCELFHQRPFVWHLWDGRRDGFNALLNYHRLAAPNGNGKRTLEKLLYTYLGDWVDRQRADQKANVEGADARLAAAEHLKAELTSILAGEPPYDIFVRWKSLAEQAIGWAPDVNDGVRMNIRPFMSAKPLGAKAKGACILRVTPKVKCDKDRGKEPQRAKEDFPWFWRWSPDDPTQATDFDGGKTFDGVRWNDLHYTTEKKRAAREVGGAK